MITLLSPVSCLLSPGQPQPGRAAEQQHEPHAVAKQHAQPDLGGRQPDRPARAHVVEELERKEFLRLAPGFGEEPARVASNRGEAVGARQPLARGPVVAEGVERALGVLAPERVGGRGGGGIVVEPEILRAGRVYHNQRVVGKRVAHCPRGNDECCSQQENEGARPPTTDH